MIGPATAHEPTLQRLFRLLVPATDAQSATEPSIELAGSCWVATKYTAIPAADAAVHYTCISYSWGPHEEPNPFAEGFNMSLRVRRALQATIASLRPQAIWVDALCVPRETAARAACLRCLGAIFGRAEQVAAVLSPESARVLEEIERHAHIEEPTLWYLESDDWVTRAWTYQEMVNSRSVKFIAEAGSNVAVDGEIFLSQVGKAIDSYKKSHGYDSFALRQVRPRLDSLEDLIADWLTRAYLDRSAYQVMSAMDRRIAQRPEDLFNAMIGAITAEIPDEGELALDAAEYFMRSCERKLDFSFIYSSAARSDAPGRRWRPLPGALHAVMPWHSWGEGQTGSLHPGHLQLEDMCPLPAGAMTTEAKQFIGAWLESESTQSEPSTTGAVTRNGDRSAEVARIYERLQQAGFRGCRQPTELQDGYLFPQRPIADRGAFEVFVAAGIRWVHGAPALVVSPVAAGFLRLREVGVFVGTVPATRRAIQVD